MSNGDVNEQQIAELGARYEAVRMNYFESRGDAESYLEAEMAFKRWTARANDMHRLVHRDPETKLTTGTVSFLSKRGWMPPITK